ncbi:MAG TPA: tetratricopeptide repeat protein [Opitutaceae bacterium]|nr:tetratricopeptide repeat protein [Opitutaceae bacterium]
MAAASLPSENRALADGPVSARNTSWYVGICLVLALATLWVYLPVRGHGFVALDDGDYVKDNRLVQAGLTWAGVKWAFTTGHSGNWHPVTWLSHMFDAQLFGPGPAAPHLVNLLIHVANTVLLFGLLRRLTGALWRSAVVAGWFALHPLHVESVAWISERKDVLSAFFFLLTLHAYTNYAAPAQSQTPNRAKWYAAALLLFAPGLMSKPMLVTLPCVLLLLDTWPLRRLAAETGGTPVMILLREKIPFFALSAASCVITLIVQARGGAVGSLASYTIAERIGNALVSYALYLGKIFRPADLAVIYPHPGQLPVLQVAGAALLVVGLCVAAVGWRRKFPFFATGWFWFFGMLVPTIGLVQVGVQAMADRYTYLPSIGVFVLLAWGAGELQARWRGLKAALGVAAAVALVSCAMRTRDQLRHWRGSEELFRHTIAVTRANYAAHNSLGHAYLELGRIDEAILQFTQTLKLRADFPEARNNLGTALLRQGRTGEAIVEFQKALSVRANFGLARYNLGTVLLENGRTDEAVAELEKAAALQPGDLLTRLNLGNARLQKGQLDGAIAQYRAALAIDPINPDLHHNLGQAFLQKGQPEAAIVHFQTALKIDPNHANAHYMLGEMSLHRAQWDDAVMHFQKTLSVQPNDADAHHHLGTALREKGRLSEAGIHFETATRLRAPSAPVAAP